MAIRPDEGCDHQESMNASAARRASTWVDPRFTEWKRGGSVPRVLERVIDDLEQYYQQPIQAIADRYWQGRDQATTVVNPSAQALAEVYGATNQYIYESSYFETLAEYQWYFDTVRCTCQQFRRFPVLDFGGGAGGLTLALSAAGIACDYADMPGTTSRYTAWRLQRHGVPASVLDATRLLPRARYLAIVTLDVFEHLPNLRGTLAQLVQALAPGGWLISKSTFSPGDPLHLPQNMVYADIRVFNELLAEFGLTYRGRLRPDPLSELQCKQWHRPTVWRVWLDPKPKFGGRFVVHERGRSGRAG